MSERMVYFIGAGPGDPKLITLKGYELLKEADCVLYAGSLINPEVLNYTNGELIDSYGLKLDELIKIMVKSVNENKKMIRLHSGDPSLYGSIIEQIEELKKHDIEVKRVPGVSSVFATAASLNTQLTLKGVSDTLIITRPKGDTLEKDLIKELSIENTTMAVFLGTSKISEVMDTVQYSKDTPVAVVYHASWEDEQIIMGTVGDIAEKVKSQGIKRSAMILIGGVVDPIHYRRSHLYGSQ